MSDQDSQATTWRGRRRRRREEKQRAREAERTRRIEEEGRKRTLAERKAAGSGRGSPAVGPLAPSSSDPQAQSPSVSPAAEATGRATPASDPGSHGESRVGDGSESATDPQARQRSAEQREEEALVAAATERADADADRRVREIEALQHEAERQVLKSRLEAHDPPSREPEPAGGQSIPLADQLRVTDQLIDSRRQRDEELRAELERTEARIEESRSRTEQALEEAAARLELIESQAGEAEQRAERAERLADLRRQEAERERRLHEMFERINEAESRARDAESRARQAVLDVSKPLDPETSPPSLPPSQAAPDDPTGGSISLNEASFEQLREAGLSVTQTGRVLAHRERSGGFRTVDELDSVPGFPRESLDQIKPRLKI